MSSRRSLTPLLERHNLPAHGWGAKGFEFWTLLSALLFRTNCSRLIELGSGRSTILFAEYAKARNASFISIETDRRWFNKARMEMRWQSLPINSIRLLKLDRATGWYDLEKFRALARSRGPFDLAMIDGPSEVGGNSRGIRDSETALEEIANYCAGTDLVIVDDVHRRHVLDTVDRMLSPSEQYEKWYYDYRILDQYPNSLCLCVRKGSPASDELPAILKLFDLRLYASLPRETCPED